MLKHLKITANDGTTLVEVLITVFILSIGVLSTMIYLVTSNASTDMARNITVATTHGEYILEEMRSRPTLANITSTNWIAWSNNNGLNTLRDESVLVSYANPSADPLNITANVTWTGFKGRTNNISLITELTK